MQSLLEYIIKVTKNAVLRPFRLLYRQIRKRLFLKNRVGRFIKGAVKGAQKSALNKPNSKAAYVKAGRRYISKRMLVIFVIILVLLPIAFVKLILPMAAGKLYTPTYMITDERIKGFNGKVRLTSQTGRLLFEGKMQDGYAEGGGILYDKEGNVRYEGDFSQDFYSGQGVLYYESARLYEGQFLANQFDGSGKAYYENGVLAYEGGFAQGAYSGEGKLYRPDGTLLYKGGFQSGLYHGYGIELSPDGDELYEGTYDMGSRSGSGTLYAESGTMQYDGGFEGGLPEGEGLMYHDNGRLRYKGALKQGLFEGDGRLFTGEGRLIYEGSFLSGNYDGAGILYRPNGRIYYDGGFKSGKYEGEGTIYGALGNPLYSGAFHKGELDVVPLVGLSLGELGNRFEISPELVASKDTGQAYVVDYPDFYFSVRSRLDTSGPVIDGFVFYGAQKYLDVSYADPAQNPDSQTQVELQGPLLEAEWVNPYTTYDWIMDKDTPLLDKDGNASYAQETYEYEGLNITIVRNANTSEILLYEIGAVSDEE